MSEWSSVAAGEVVTQRKDVVALEPGVEYRTMGVRWYGRGAYDRGIGTTETIKAKRLWRASAGDFVFNRIDTQNGAFDVIPPALDGALATNEFPLYIADPQRLHVGFLHLYFQQGDVLRQIDARRAGSEGRSRWKEEDFESWRIPLPPLPEQRRIVDFMATVDAQIESLAAERDKAASVLHTARLALLIAGPDSDFAATTTDSHSPLTWTDSLPAGWRRALIREVATTRTGSTPLRAMQGRYFDGGTIRWVKTGDLNERVLSETDERITETAVDETSVCVLPVDTVLVAMYGGFGQIGRTARLGEPSATNQAISALTDFRSDLLPAFLHEALKAGRPKWRLVAASSRKDPNISKKDVEAFDFPLPPIEQQQQIVEILRALEATSDAIESERARLSALRSTLLTSLLNQEIEIPESYDQILERVS